MAKKNLIKNISPSSIYFMIGACISADTCLDLETSKAALKTLTKLKQDIACRPDAEDFSEMIDNGIEIIKNEIEHFSEDCK